jgi:cytochrome c biogenesis protein CcdA/thiol-disulfide isomerase/thioredoxin
VLLLFAFFAGIVTILSPCILPVLPIVLSGSLSENKHRPLGIVIGFIASFTFFTLFLSLLVKLLHIPANLLRDLSILILLLFGLSLLVPKLQVMMETFFSSLSGTQKNQSRTGFIGGIVIGLSLGLLWTPCVGPILAAVISLALTDQVSVETFAITFAYALGTAIPMFLIMLTGRKLFLKFPHLLNKTSGIQKGFGVLMILLSIGLFFNLDRSFQTWMLTTFPQYGSGLTVFEQNPLVKSALKHITSSTQDASGQPSFEMQKGRMAHEIIPGGQWFNVRDGKTALTMADLKGKVVLIDFWTYSCINCQRTFPYLKTWWEKYKDQGLVIIGVHTPEFEFEKDPKNVAQALKDFGITYPVVQDNNFATWKAYENDSWPAEYLIDKDGHIRFQDVGEGGYAEKEKNIQTLLNELHPAKPVTNSIDDKDYQLYSNTPETYLGYYRIANLDLSEQVNPDQKAAYNAPSQLAYNTFAFDGDWTVNQTYAVPEKGASVFYHVDAKDVYFLMEPMSGPVTVQIEVDGKAQFPGDDVKNGVITVDKSRLYHVAHFETAGEHVVRLRFLDGKVKAYTFTFG